LFAEGVSDGRRRTWILPDENRARKCSSELLDGNFLVPVRDSFATVLFIDRSDMF